MWESEIFDNWLCAQLLPLLEQYRNWHYCWSFVVKYIHVHTYMYIPGLHLGGAFHPPWLDFAPPPLEFMSTNNYNHCDHQPKQLFSYSSYSTRLQEMLLSTEAVATRIDKLMLASVLKFQHIIWSQLLQLQLQFVLRLLRTDEKFSIRNWR